MVRSGRAPVDAAPDCLSPPLLLHAASSTAPDPTRNDLRLTPATTGRTYRRTMAADSQLTLSVNGQSVTVADDGASLLEVLRDRAGIKSAKDGCSPQGQCGCCTVLVDGEPRVACVTPARRVAGSIDHDRRGHGRTRAALGRRLRRDRCEPMRVLHARHRRSSRRVARARRRARRHRPRRARAPRTPVPVHRLAHDPRRVAGVRRRRDPWSEPRSRTCSRPCLARGRVASAGRTERGARRWRLRGRHRTRRCARRGLRRPRRLVGRRDASRRAACRGKGAGTTNDR